MGANWKSEDFSEGGLKGIKRFTGRLENVEEDVEGKYAIQKRFDWQDVEILESSEPVVLKEGQFSDWMKQSGSVNSVDAKVVAHLEKFCADNKIKGSLPACLYELDIEWEQFIVEFDGEGTDGTAMQPGYAYAPIKLVGKAEKKATPARGRKAKDAPDETESSETPEPEEPESSDESDSSDETVVEVPELIRDKVIEVLGEDGATRDMIVRELKKTAKLRKALGTVEDGIEAVLGAMESSHAIGSDGDFYFPAPEETEEAGF